MNLKHYLTSLTILSFSLTGFSQNYTGNPETDIKDVQSMKHSTLLVVVDSAESELGKTIMNSFNKYWKFTKFKFIKSSDIDKNINNPDVSFFDFIIIGGYKKGSEFVSTGWGASLMGIGGKDQFVILDNNILPGKVYYRNRNIVKSAKCYFALFAGNPDMKKMDGGFYSGVNVVDYLTPTQPETGLYQKGMWHNQVQFDLNQTLNTDEKITIPYIPFYIQRLQQHLEYISEHNNLPKTKKDDEKISWEYKGGANSDVAKITSYDDGLEQIKSMKILVDSSITDEFGVKIFVKSLGISEDAVKLVPWSEIENAINSKDAGVAILYQPRLDYTADPGYVFWTTDGKRLIDWNFRHIGTNSTYCFGFRKDDNFDCERNEVHLK